LLVRYGSMFRGGLQRRVAGFAAGPAGGQVVPEKCVEQKTANACTPPELAAPGITDRVWDPKELLA
jgi:hypothetical protein